MSLAVNILYILQFILQQLPDWDVSSTTQLGETLHDTNTFTFVIKKNTLDRQTYRLIFNYL